MMRADNQLEAIRVVCTAAGAPAGCSTMDQVEWMAEQLKAWERASKPGREMTDIRKILLGLGVGVNAHTTLQMFEKFVARLNAAEGQEATAQ